MPKRDAFEAALAALNRKERTAHELALWLRRRDFDLEEIESALRRLFEAGALDDERFARLFAEDKRELSGGGGGRIRGAPLWGGSGSARPSSSAASSGRPSRRW